MQIDEQFLSIMAKLQPKAYNNAAKALASEVSKEIVVNTDAAKTFPGQTYDPKYRDRTVSERRALGFQVSKVDLKREMRRIAETVVTSESDFCATLRWKPITVRSGVTSGRLWFYHHHGMGTNPKREIIPKTHSAIPKGIIIKTKKAFVSEFDNI